MADFPIDVPPHVAETIRAIALLHAEHHRKATLTERIVDGATAFVGRPRFLIAMLFLALVWMAANSVVTLDGGRAVDPPPFAWMEVSLTVVALFIAVMILASQQRADRLADLREQMTLESALLTEQKTRKIIELLEELRRDSPGIRDRLDVEAEQMSAKADPHEVLSAIVDVTQQAASPAAKA